MKTDRPTATLVRRLSNRVWVGTKQELLLRRRTHSERSSPGINATQQFVGRPQQPQGFAGYQYSGVRTEELCSNQADDAGANEQIGALGDHNFPGGPILKPPLQGQGAVFSS